MNTELRKQATGDFEKDLYKEARLELSSLHWDVRHGSLQELIYDFYHNVLKAQYGD